MTTELKGAETVFLPSGTYTLTRAGSGGICHDMNACAKGEGQGQGHKLYREQNLDQLARYQLERRQVHRLTFVVAERRIHRTQ